MLKFVWDFNPSAAAYLFFNGYYMVKKSKPDTRSKTIKPALSPAKPAPPTSKNPAQFVNSPHGGRIKPRKKGMPRPEGAGRKKGTPNKVNKLIKDALVEAAEKVGENGKGSLGIVGYFMRIAKQRPDLFCGMIGKIIPLQIQGSGPNGELQTVTYRSRTDVIDELKARGLPIESVFPDYEEPALIEGSATSIDPDSGAPLTDHDDARNLVEYNDE